MQDSGSPQKADGVSDKEGHLFIVSAPSGAGKTTLCAAVRKHFNDLAYSISFTSRTIRKGEQEGRDYHFISANEFEQGIASNRWAEWAKVHGNYYGTSAQWIDRVLDAGDDILMDIDVQGTRQMLERFEQAVTIFIMPPSIEALESRLKLRGQDDLATINLRLKNAKAEMTQKELYQHIIVNDDLTEATQKFIDLLQHHRNSQLSG